jgi:arylformamidase
MSKKIIDLTHTMHNDMQRFHAEWHQKTEITQMGTIEKVGRETKRILMGSHAGTHIDAPRHFFQEGRTLDEFDLSCFIGPVTVCDFSNLSENEAVTVEMMKDIEIREKMIFYFGWSKMWTSNHFYHHYPYFSKELAMFLVEKGVKFIGMDTPSPDDSRIELGSDRDSEIHKIFLHKNILLVEYLNNLEQVDFNVKWEIIALPMKFQNADGSTCEGLSCKSIICLR